MSVTHNFEAVRSHERFRVTARAAASGIGRPYVELLVEDTESRASLKLVRPELMPLLGALKEALKEVEDAAAGLPSDPVERATRRIPHTGMASSMQRAYMLKAYREALAELQEGFIQRIDTITAQSIAPRPPPTE